MSIKGSYYTNTKAIFKAIINLSFKQSKAILIDNQSYLVSNREGIETRFPQKNRGAAPRKPFGDLRAIVGAKRKTSHLRSGVMPIEKNFFGDF